MKYKLAIVLSIAMLLASCTNIHSSVSADDTYVTEESTTIETDTDTEVSDTTEAEKGTDTDVPDDGKVHVSKIELDKYEVNIEVGGSDMPWVTMLPENAENKSEIWKSSDEKLYSAIS